MCIDSPHRKTVFSKTGEATVQKLINIAQKLKHDLDSDGKNDDDFLYDSIPSEKSFTDSSRPPTVCLIESKLSYLSSTQKLAPGIGRIYQNIEATKKKQARNKCTASVKKGTKEQGKKSGATKKCARIRIASLNDEEKVEKKMFTQTCRIAHKPGNVIAKPAFSQTHNVKGISKLVQSMDC